MLAALGAGCALHDDPTIGAEPRSLQPSSEGARSGVTSATASDLEQFVRQVADDANLTWAKDFKRRDKPFTPARPAFYAAGSAPSCDGRGDDSCPRETAFFDLTLQQLASERFGAESKPVSAYAIAHEMGHHVQRVLGIDGEIERLLASRPIAAHAVGIQVELQADCLAGVWARSSRAGPWLSPSEVEVALRRASEIGLERRAMKRGPTERAPESFTYAVPRQRIYWFARGFSKGKIEDCDTFAP